VAAAVAAAVAAVLVLRTWLMTGLPASRGHF